jgi:peptide chain release factor 2
MDKKDIETRITGIERAMNKPDFWDNPAKAQDMIKELQELKIELEGGSKYDSGGAIVTVFAGVGGDDAEDFVRILLEMYMKYFESKGWTYNFLDENKSEHGGYKTITLEIGGKKVYGNLKHEAGVHRLVRKSPFNSAGKRQTSFAMVEVLPRIDLPAGEAGNLESRIRINEDDLEIGFTKSSGPGGQNVNKRDTAVRVVHRPTGISAFVSNERSQVQNKEKALQIVEAKLYNLLEEQEKKEIKDLSVTKDTSATWGSQIRSYVLDPYKLVKDHRTNLEIRNVDKVFGGDLDEFINEMKNNN